MRIIYYSYWGTYAAYTMAALQAGIYRPNCLPPDNWVTAQYELCRRYGDQYGNLIYVGLDSHFREVYSLGCRQHAGMVIRVLQYISKIFHIEEPIHFVDASQVEGKLPALLQKPCFQNRGAVEKLFIKWFQEKYPVCLQEVQRTKQTLKDGII